MEEKGREKGKIRTVYCIALCCFCLVLGVILGLMLKSNQSNNEDYNAQNQESIQSEQTEQGGEEADVVEDFFVETPYCNLYYPKQWKEQVRIEKVEGEVYTVAFYGQIEGKEEQHLFSVAFGGEEGGYIGTLQTEDGTFEMYIVSEAFTPDETWAQEETNTIYAMQEAVNHVIQRLKEEKGFTD